jgi:phage terminase large subunit-like protein
MQLHQLDALPAKLRLAFSLEEKVLRRRLFRFGQFFQDTGPLRRELYQKHLAFFRFGATHQIRGLMSANRIGKTEGGGGYELTCHLTGRYPPWWEGARFTERVRAWAAGDTRQTTKEIIQQKLLGDFGKFGTGMIPAADIVKTSPLPGVPEAVGTVWVKHYDWAEYARTRKWVQDGTSRLSFKSYDQGREAFQGTEQEVIWLDEEADEGIRGECIVRLMTTDGILIETFTPLKGMTPVVMTYLPNGYEEGMTEAVTDNRALVMAGWDDVPHLTEEQKRKMLAETLPHLIDARSKGIPSIGAGAVYPLAESEFLVDDIPILAGWPRAYALDVGWNRTAAVWGAQDPNSKIVYLYAEYYRGQAEPPIHAAAIKKRGDWIPGVVDPSARGRSQKDGEKLLDLYTENGLHLKPSANDVDTGLLIVWQGLSTGSIKVFKSLQNWRREYRMYHRNEKGVIVKENDHLMDATRYLALSGMKRAKVMPPKGGEIYVGRIQTDPGIGLVVAGLATGLLLLMEIPWVW